MDTETQEWDSIIHTHQRFLSDEEHVRCRRFQLPKYRRQFVLTRLLCRFLLSYYRQEVRPSEWLFDKVKNGKPVIATLLNQPLYFNISHSAERIMMAVANEPDLGVDIECIQPMKKYESIVECFFTQRERSWIYQAPVWEQVRRFYQLWTLKEAYVKGMGLGLAVPFNHFTIDIQSDKPLLLLEQISGHEKRTTLHDRWHLRCEALGDEYIYSIAYPRSSHTEKSIVLSYVTEALFMN